MKAIFILFLCIVFNLHAASVAGDGEFLNRTGFIEVGENLVHVPVENLRPTQTAIGAQNVEAMMEGFTKGFFEKLGIEWKKPTQKQYKAISEKGYLDGAANTYFNISKLKKAQQIKLSKLYQDWFDHKPVEGILTFKDLKNPGTIGAGNVESFHFDGHHRSRTISNINEIFDNISGKTVPHIMATIKVVGDYTVPEKGHYLTEKEVADKIFNKFNEGYISPEILKTYDGKGKPNNVWKMNQFASSIKSANNDVYRATMGTLFFEMGIDPELLIDYSEFIVGEELESLLKKNGINIGARYTQEEIEKIKLVLANEPKFFEHMGNDMARDASTKKKAQLMIESVHQKLRASFQEKGEKLANLLPRQKIFHRAFANSDKEYIEYLYLLCPKK